MADKADEPILIPKQGNYQSHYDILP